MTTIDAATDISRPDFPDAEPVEDVLVRDPELSIPFRGKARKLVFEMTLDRPLDEVFPFFADAHNLERITPDILRFRVLTPKPIDMQAGALIDYKLRLRGFPMKWRTRITVWDPPHRFVDTQLKGPYKLWHHEHTFEASGERTICRDIVHYAHLGGSFIDKLLVRPDVKRIFAYRQNAMREVFEGTR